MTWGENLPARLRLVSLFYLLVVSQTTAKVIKNVMLFGDSYTGEDPPIGLEFDYNPFFGADQSRQHSINNGTFPGKNYQQIYPPVSVQAWNIFRLSLTPALSGRYSWRWRGPVALVSYTVYVSRQFVFILLPGILDCTET
jgi:hypothetical protein